MKTKQKKNENEKERARKKNNERINKQTIKLTKYSSSADKIASNTLTFWDTTN